MLVLDTSSGPDGLVKLDKKYFALPEVNQIIRIRDSRGKIVAINGEQACKVVDIINRNKADSIVKVNASTEPGMCGSPYIDSNGKIVAIHSQAGDKVANKTVNNCGVGITDSFLNSWFFPQPKKP